MSVSFVVPMVGSIILLALLYASTFLELVQLWWHDHNYSHGFLVPIIALYLVLERKDVLKLMEPKSSAWGIPVLVGALLFLLAGKGIELAGGERGALFLKGISLIIACAAILLLVIGKAILSKMVFPLAYLLFMLPLPDGPFAMLTVPLQNYATSVTTTVLQLLHVPALREGNLIYLPMITLNVTEACSGIRSMLTLLAAATVLSYLTVHYWWQHVILIGSVLPIAVITNAFRVTGTGVLAYFVGKEAAQGFFHGFSGWALLIMASVLLCAEILFLMKLPADFEQGAVV